MRMISTTLLLIMSFNILAQTASTEQETCEAAGKIWIEGQGCRVSQSLVDLRTNAAECEDLEGDELTACTQNAAQATADSLNQQHRNSIKKDEGLVYAAALITSVATGIAFLRQQKKGICTQPSYWLLFGGSIAALTGEIISRVTYNKKIKDAKESYDKLETDKDPTAGDYLLNKQLDAFNKLIEIESARESAEKIRQTTYVVSSVAYAGAAVAATIEAILLTTPAEDAKCTASSVGNSESPHLNDLIDIETLSSLDRSYEPYLFLKKVSVIEFIEISVRKALNQLMPSAHAAGVFAFIGQLGAGLGKAAEDTSKGISKLFGNFGTRIALSSVLSIGSGLLAKQAKKIKETSASRQDELRKLRDKFAETAGIATTRCTDAMRSDSSNPSCFCYLEDGTKDASKRNLVICVENWGNSNVTTAGNYNTSSNTTANSGIQTCVTKSYESDLGCKCKTNNSCLTVGSNSLNFGRGMSWAGQILGSTNSVFSNGLESAAANLSTYENQAATLNKKFDEMSKDSKYKDAIAKAKGLEAKILKSTKSQARSFLNSNPSAKSLLSVGGESNSSAQDVKKTEAKIVASLPKKFSSALKAKKLDSFDLDFGEENGSGVEVVGDDANAKADYKYDAVLHKNPDASIFKILSNRYMKTGVKNLFEEKLEEKKQ